MKIITTVLLLASLWIACLSGCSPAKTKSEAQPSPGPSAQHGNNPAGESSATSSSTPLAKPGAETSEPATSNSAPADELHTPPKGSSERQSLMDALREEFNNPQSGYYQPHRGSIVFVVNKLKVHNGWAWMYAEPHSSDASDSFGENNGFLLHLEGEKWQVMKLPSMVEDPNDPENLDYPSRKDIEQIRKMYPSIAIDIFEK